ncbi:SDR family NAD(P)-dependent oxidoreductase [Nocardia aurea]|uniref:SDR family NAD(P)-dependent oxidoreductase n=1 Tax=Nocardia aurea TaxID=2144174 RepID=UPI0033B7B980
MTAADTPLPPPHPPVSIVGMGCRVPGADGLDEFWELLRTGRDATGEPPGGRSVTRHAGYLSDIDRFDNDWFAISAREAASMDPQQRLALEVAIEAIDDAGIGYRTRGRGAAVVFGACGFDHGVTVLGSGGHDAPYAVTGSALSIIANRLSYVLDLRGPSLVVDSACSSSLAAVDIALRLLADETVPFAIVGGVNLTLLPYTSDYLAESGFLAEDGRCKPFDATADGYTRSDGCGVIVLRRTADAHRAGDRIYAEIAGAAVGSDGRSNGLYAPNGRAQQDTIRTAWSRAGLDPRSAGYIECHGTGTALGDAVEVGALAAVLATDEPDRAPIRIGSLKSNLGHLEAAAGVTGLIKTALSIHHATIAPTIHITTENALLKLGERGLEVPTEPVDWSTTPRAERHAGVSSFGFGGTNAHVVLRGVARTPGRRDSAGPLVIPVTGRDIAEIRMRAEDLITRLEVGRGVPTTVDGADVAHPVRSAKSTVYAAAADTDAANNVAASSAAAGAHIGAGASAGAGPSTGTGGTGGADGVGSSGPGVGSEGAGRSSEAGGDGPTGSTGSIGGGAGRSDGGPAADTGTWSTLHRVAVSAARALPETTRAVVTAHDIDQARERLRALASGDSGPGVIGPSSARRRGGVLFLFSGQGGQHPRMGRSLAARWPVFARAVTAATDAVVAAGGPRVWTPRHGFALGDEATEFVQPALFAYQVASAELFASWGVRPDGVVGHSLGEIAGAVSVGALSLADGAHIAVRRSRALGALDGQGAMALLEAAPEEAAQLVEPVRASVGIAAINGPRSVVVSGVPRYIDTVVRRARRRDMFAQRIAVDFAAHSPQVAPVLPDFVEALSGLTPHTPHTRLYSTARRATLVDSATLTADYWADNVSGTVELGAALDLAAADGFTSVVEISPHPVLVSSVREYRAFRDSAYPGAAREDEAEAFLETVARLYIEGRAVNWSALGPFTGPEYRRRWQRRRFAPTARIDRPAAKPEFVPDLLDDHVVLGAATVPAVYWLRRLSHLAGPESATMLADFVVDELTELSALPRIAYHADDSTGTLRVTADGAVPVASARPDGHPSPADIVAWMRLADANRAVRHQMHGLEAGYFYAQLRGRALEYGPRFRPLRRIATGSGRALGTFEDAEPHSTATLDGCLHLLAAACYDDLPDEAIPLPIGIESAWVSTESDRVVVEGHALITEYSESGLVGDVVATDQHGAPVLALCGVRIRFADHLSRVPAAEQSAVGPAVAFRQETWHPLHPEAIGRPDADARPRHARRALVVGESALAIRLARTLETIVPTERAAREPDAAAAVVASALLRRGSAERTAVVLVWPDEPGTQRDSITTVGRVLGLLQHLQTHDATASLTVVLPLGCSPAAHATAGLIRSLQLESGRTIRLVWTDHDPENTAVLAGLVTAEPEAGLPEEIRLTGGDAAIRRFTVATADTAPPTIDPHGTYVVTGGLGALGAMAVRWLLDAGAHDVVVLTRSPRPVPTALDGFEERIVVVRCDATDRGDLSNALSDIRECGSTIRGVVHAAGTLEDAVFDDIGADQLARMAAPKIGAAGDLLELTAGDPIDFVLLFSSATGALGAPGQAAYAAANAGMDALAASVPRRRVISIGWGTWASGLAEAAGGAIHLRRAGIAALDPARGAEMLGRALRHTGPYLLAVDYAPTSDRTPVANRLRTLLAPGRDLRNSPARPHPVDPEPTPPGTATPEPLTATIRRIVAATVGIPAESIPPTADFNDLGLSSLLAIELRRALETRLSIAISTAELFRHPTVAALGAALSDRVAAVDSEEAS